MMKARLDKSKYVPITQNMIDRLLQLKKETGCGFQSLYKYGKNHTDHEVYKETTDTLPHHWVIGTTKTLNIEYFNSIVSTYESLPEDQKRRWGVGNKEVSEDFRDSLKAFIDKPRNLSLAKTLKYSNAPQGLSPATIGKIANGKILSIDPEYKEYLEKLLASQ